MRTLSIILLSFFILQANAQNDLNQAAGNWGGAIELPDGSKLKVVFHVTNMGEALKATMDSPDQGAYNLNMDKAEFSDNTLTMTMNQIQGTYKGTLKDS